MIAATVAYCPTPRLRSVVVGKRRRAIYPPHHPRYVMNRTWARKHKERAS